MNGFQKRVALLEKWAPNLVPKLKDIDDLADIILDVWDEAEAHTEERTIKLLDVWDCNNDRCDCDSINECVYRQQLIALIKGENK